MNWTNQTPTPQDLAGKSEEYFWVRGGHFNRPVMVRANNGVTSDKTATGRAYRAEVNFSFFTEGYPDCIWAGALPTWPGLTGLEWAGPVPRPAELTSPCGMRYFMFTYTWIGSAEQGVGTLWLGSETFPALQMLKDAANKNCPEEAGIVITGWNEFESEADYEAFLSGQGAQPT